jgi:hypothetical protein
MVHDPTETSFTITATLTNISQTDVYLDDCPPIAQRQIGGIWVTVFDLDCGGGGIYQLLIPSSGTDRTVRVFGSTDPHITPLLDPRMTAGTYRLVWQLYTNRGNGDLVRGATAASNTFTVSDPVAISVTPAGSR